MRSLYSLPTIALVASVALLHAACSSSDSSSTSSSGGSSGSSGGADSGTADTGADTGAGPTVAGCTTYADHTAAGDARSITWSFAITSDPNRCTMVKVGQTVTWAGDFVSHPITGKDGDSPNPIANIDTGTGKVTFTTAGTFGYACTVHPAMIGAIRVVP